MEGQKDFVQIDQNDLFPYLLVNVGSGVSMIKVKQNYIHFVKCLIVVYKCPILRSLQMI